jgi:hypothetical protein
VIRGSRIESEGYVVEHKGKEAVKIEGSEASGLEGLMLISGESVIEGSTIEGTKTGIEIRDRAEIELRGVKVKSGETGVKIEGTRKREFKGIETEILVFFGVDPQNVIKGKEAQSMGQGEKKTCKSQSNCLS